MRIPYISLAAVGALALSGCAYGGYGGYGGGYGSLSYGSAGYYGDYGYGSPYYGYGGSPYYGWYDDFYYPGVGIYVYDRHRHRRVWNDRQRHHWTNRRQAVVSRSRTRPVLRQNWSGFSSRATALQRQEARQERQRARQERRQPR
ncbi:MAG TPA: hypothetical protein VFM42_06770 [Sphingomicrobium sp.]|jgi:hypothetical protein|nr:hypothetical protein [Sphingomicrobium sp.]